MASWQDAGLREKNESSRAGFKGMLGATTICLRSPEFSCHEWQGTGHHFRKNAEQLPPPLEESEEWPNRVNGVFGIDKKISNGTLILDPRREGLDKLKVKTMKRNSKKQTLDRMNYLIGHLQANRKMIEGDKYCIDVIRQNDAVISALKKVNDLILNSHLETCATTAIKDGNIKKRQKILKELLDIYQAK